MLQACYKLWKLFWKQISNLYLLLKKYKRPGQKNPGLAAPLQRPGVPGGDDVAGVYEAANSAGST